MERVSVAAPGAGVGYTRASMASLLRDFRAGKVQMFTPPARPGPKSAPAKDRARARVVQLRHEGLSVHEISSRLRAEATPLNRTGVGQILAEEGFGRLVRGPEPHAGASPGTAGRDTHLPRASVIDFAAFPARADTSLAGLLLVVPDLVALDLPALVARAGYPGTAAIPAVSGDPVPAGAETDRHPAGLPRRGPDQRPGQCPVRRGCRCCRRSPRSPTTPTG